MKERVERLAMEIREILGEIVTRQEIKDPRVHDAGLITITHVRLTGDLREATALFTVHGADAEALKQVRKGLNSAGGYLRHRLGKQLTVRAVPDGQLRDRPGVRLRGQGGFPAAGDRPSAKDEAGPDEDGD